MSSNSRKRSRRERYSTTVYELAALAPSKGGVYHFGYYELGDRLWVRVPASMNERTAETLRLRLEKEFPKQHVLLVSDAVEIVIEKKLDRKKGAEVIKNAEESIVKALEGHLEGLKEELEEGQEEDPSATGEDVEDEGEGLGESVREHAEADLRSEEREPSEAGASAES